MYRFPGPAEGGTEAQLAEPAGAGHAARRAFSPRPGVHRLAPAGRARGTWWSGGGKIS